MRISVALQGILKIFQSHGPFLRMPMTQRRSVLLTSQSPPQTPPSTLRHTQRCSWKHHERMMRYLVRESKLVFGCQGLDMRCYTLPFVMDAAPGWRERSGNSFDIYASANCCVSPCHPAECMSINKVASLEGAFYMRPTPSKINNIILNLSIICCCIMYFHLLN